MQLKSILFLLCLLSSIFVQAQSNRKALHFYNSALEHWSDRDIATACHKMERAIEKDPLSAEPYSVLGKWYFDMNEFSKAANVFRSGYKNSKYGKNRFALPFAKCLIYTGKPDSALLILNTAERKKDTTELQALREQAMFVKHALANATFSNPLNLGVRINTRYAEMFPYLSHDMQSLYFTRRINKFNEDIFQARADSCGGWLRADNSGATINSPNEESATCISADGHYLFFTRCEIKSDNGWEGGGCDLYMSYRTSTDSNWYFPEPFGATINTPAYEGMPTLSPDNKSLYFVSDRPGGYGGLDIWVARFEDGLWQLPVNAGPEINTAGNEVAPYIDADNRTLYFCSDGHPGMGGYDIYMARRKNDTEWNTPTNMGYPINSAYDEVSECVSPDGKELYFASDRYNKKGNFDIYEAEIPRDFQPYPVNFVNGFVYDSISKERLNSASILVINLAHGDTVYRFESNRGDGSYEMPLQKNTSYHIHTARFEYTAVDDTLVLGDKNQQNTEFDIAMVRADYVKPILDSQLVTVHFDLNKVELTEADKTAIRDAVTPWLLEKGFVIHVNGYTDNTGSPMINEELSTKRAKLVAKEIMKLGVDELMIEAHGWGEAKMIAPNDNDQNQKKNRRVEVSLSR